VRLGVNRGLNGGKNAALKGKRNRVLRLNAPRKSRGRCCAKAVGRTSAVLGDIGHAAVRYNYDAVPAEIYGAVEVLADDFEFNRSEVGLVVDCCFHFGEFLRVDQTTQASIASVLRIESVA
jgi:hypothetical protein